MKLPAVAIAAAFASGVALGLDPAVVAHVTCCFFLMIFFACLGATNIRFNASENT